MSAKQGGARFFNREMSWLEFNQRILDLAADTSLPLLERLRFLTITSSNLDEFFMVRAGGLQTLDMQRSIRKDLAGMTPARQLTALYDRTRKMTARQYECLEELDKAMTAEGIRRVRTDALTSEQREHCALLFEREVFPILTPMAFGANKPLPLLSNRMLYLGVRLKGELDDGSLRLAVVPLGRPVQRLLTLPSRGGYEYILVEDLVGLFVDRLFPGDIVQERAALRITRNADMSVREDLAADLLAQMEAVLDQRKRSECVRFEVDSGASKALVNAFVALLETTPEAVYRASGPLDLASLSTLCDLKGHPKLLNEPWTPQPVPEITEAGSVFDAMKTRDLLLYHPFESFDPVVAFVQQAAADPDVVAIKQVLYRTSRKSPITAALMDAAHAGKSVTALMELKARFDEARNIEWAQELEDAGVQVIYGVKGLKTHAKISIVIRREAGMLRRYMHFGTGNYNEATARLYTDVSYMTIDEDLGADASAFFNAISGYSQPQRYLKLEAAPIGLRDKIVNLIDAEAASAREGRTARIRAKLNSLADQKTIKALYEASKAGVKIELNVRGICCLRPGVEGLSENISVLSIVDRCLEHSRIFQFHADGQQRVFISSADWMPRNFDRRVELLVPVEDPRCRDRLIAILDTCFADNAHCWSLRADGSYERLSPSGKKARVRSQEEQYRRACATVESARTARPTMFEPHRPPGAT